MLSLRCPINFLGYGIVGLNILKSLIQDHNQEIFYFPMGQPQADPQYHEMIYKAIDNQNNFVSDTPSLTIWHEHDLFARVSKGVNASLSFFELDTFNTRTKNSLSNMDILITPSEWSANILKKECPQQTIKVIKMGVDSQLFQPIAIQKQDETYRFLNIGKWEIRKSADILVDIFNKAFTQEDNVELIMSCSNPFLNDVESKKWIDLYKNSSLGNKIQFAPRISTEELVKLYNFVDCGIFPTRAEAICLPALEMLSCSKPIIITNYSGQTAFVNKENSYLVDIDKLVTAYDGVWFHGDGNWADIGEKQIDQFVEHMRNCYKNKITTNLEGRKTAEEMTWKETTKNILEVINA